MTTSPTYNGSKTMGDTNTFLSGLATAHAELEPRWEPGESPDSHAEKWWNRAARAMGEEGVSILGIGLAEANLRRGGTALITAGGGQFPYRQVIAPEVTGATEPTYRLRYVFPTDRDVPVAEYRSTAAKVEAWNAPGRFNGVVHTLAFPGYLLIAAINPQRHDLSEMLDWFDGFGCDRINKAEYIAANLGTAKQIELV